LFPGWQAERLDVGRRLEEDPVLVCDRDHGPADPVGAQRLAQRAGAGTLEVRASHAIAMTRSTAFAGQITAATSAVPKAA
jgi:hypothetical protein